MTRVLRDTVLEECVDLDLDFGRKLDIQMCLPALSLTYTIISSAHIDSSIFTSNFLYNHSGRNEASFSIWQKRTILTSPCNFWNWEPCSLTSQFNSFSFLCIFCWT